MRWRWIGAGRGLALMMVAGGLVMGVTTGAAGAASTATAAQKAQAEKALLVLSDLPAGWTSTQATTTSGGGFTGAPQLARCIGVPAKLIQSVPPQVNSAQFSSASGADTVQDSISIYPSSAYANEEYTAVASSKTPHCLTSLFNTGAGSGAKASVTRLSSPKGATAFAIDIGGSSGSGAGGSSQATSQAARTETVFFAHGQYGDSISIETPGGQAAPTSLVDHLVSVAKGRL
jgi:hypothetical protein